MREEVSSGAFSQFAVLPKPLAIQGMVVRRDVGFGAVLAAGDKGIISTGLVAENRRVPRKQASAHCAQTQK
jgi:hypothetical protein